MPLYNYINEKTGEIFEEYRSMSKSDEPFIAPDGTVCQRDKTPCWEGSLEVKEGKSRFWQKDEDLEKKAKDPERARRNRIKAFGSEGVSITKSEHYKKEKRIKRKETGTMDKVDFVKQAANNPKAVEAAQRVMKGMKA